MCSLRQGFAEVRGQNEMVADLGMRSLNGLRTLEGFVSLGDARIDDHEEESHEGGAVRGAHEASRDRLTAERERYHSDTGY
jgi:hypothetical protein